MSHVLPRRAVVTGGAVFVASDAITFVALLGAATSLRMNAHDWPTSTADVKLVGALTVVLFACSALLGVARTHRAALVGVALCALGFVAGEALEWRALIRAHLGPSSDLRHAALFVITGLHATHVLAGALYALVLLRKRRPDVGVLALYWAGLDIAWLAIWLVVYR